MLAKSTCSKIKRIMDRSYPFFSRQIFPGVCPILFYVSKVLPVVVRSQRYFCVVVSLTKKLSSLVASFALARYLMSGFDRIVFWRLRGWMVRLPLAAVVLLDISPGVDPYWVRLQLVLPSDLVFSPDRNVCCDHLTYLTYG